MTMTYFISPVCRTLEAPDYRTAQNLARKLHPKGKALPVECTGVVRPDDTVLTATLDTYA